MSSDQQQQQDPAVVATLNNTAAHEMLRGNHMKAVRMLSTALKQTSQYLHLSKTLDQNVIEQEGGSSPQEFRSHLQLQQSFCSFLSLSQSREIIGSSRRAAAGNHEFAADDDDDQECFLFSSPLQIDFSHDTAAAAAVRSSPSSLRMLAETFSHAIVYNLALCHHLAAMAIPETCGSKRRNHLRRAVALYDQAKRLLVKELKPIHRIVVFNNLGHANRTLGSEEVSKKHFRQVLMIIASETASMLSTATTTSSSRQESSSSVQLDGFLRNALHWVSGSCTTVAAAA